MRVRVASTGGEAGSTSAGNAERRSARYSSTGSTTQPSPVVAAFCAWPAVARMVMKSAKQNSLARTSDALLNDVEAGDRFGSKLSRFASEASVRIGFMVFLLYQRHALNWWA